MGIEKQTGKNVIIELKNGSKYFGIIEEVDNSDTVLVWVTIKTKNGRQLIVESEILRVEVLE